MNKDTRAAILRGMGLDPDTKPAKSTDTKPSSLAGFGAKQAAAKSKPVKAAKSTGTGNGQAIRQLSKGDW